MCLERMYIYKNCSSKVFKTRVRVAALNVHCQHFMQANIFVVKCSIQESLYVSWLFHKHLCCVCYSTLQGQEWIGCC